MVPGSPPTPILAAQLRLAIAGIGNGRLGAAVPLSTDIVGKIAVQIRGFDQPQERSKLQKFGEAAAGARFQFRPPLPAAGEKPQATGFLLEDHPIRKYNGVYRLISENEGWPVLRNEYGMHCYHQSTMMMWVLNPTFKPEAAASRQE